MPLKIFHTADLHIGMKFNNYPEPIKSALQHARLDSLKNMVKTADQQGCNLFVISGDLFNGISGIDKKSILSVVTVLESFQGQCVLVMPGNHDYDNDMVDLWNSFKSKVSDKILFVNHEHLYSLADYDINAVVYPAPCHSKHSSTNNLGWIREQNVDNFQVNIGIAHGAIIGISPDMDSNYFNMTLDELNNIPMDVWLLGHTHITYPPKASVAQWKIFNPGTPEPDGLDCKHCGSAWIITIDDNKEVNAETIVAKKNPEAVRNIFKRIEDAIRVPASDVKGTSAQPNKFVKDIYNNDVEAIIKSINVENSRKSPIEHAVSSYSRKNGKVVDGYTRGKG